MKILPIAVTPKKALLIGAGKVAAQKAKVIGDSDAALTIIAERVVDSYFQDRAVILKTFDANDLEVSDFDIVINATGNKALSEWLWVNRRRYRFWLNCVDEPEYCDFYFGATFRDHDLCVSVSTGGASPSYAQKIRDVIAACVPKQPQQFYQTLRQKRAKVTPFAPQTPRGNRVYLMGCGPGRLDHLTLQAVKVLPTLNVALVDALVGEEITKLLPNDCLKIYVGKEKGSAAKTQEEINALMLYYANEGYTVGRLKGGDPAIFARLFEEASFLAERQVETTIINGVSSCLAGSVVAGVPLTMRDIAEGVLVVSAHRVGGKFNETWLPIVASRRYTVAVLMGLTLAREIEEAAARHGVDLNTPAAFVSKIDTDEEKTIIGSLGDLSEMAALSETPAVLLIGEAVSKANTMPHTGARVFLSEHRQTQTLKHQAA